MSGSQRVPLLTGMNANGGADAGHKRRLENRLMVRRRERRAGVAREFEELSNEVSGQRPILPRASGHRGNIKVLI